MKTLLGSQLWLHVWDDDGVIGRQIDDMLACGLNVARVFLPWNQIEPADNQWDFDLFDRLFHLCEEKGMLLAPTLTCALGESRWMDPALQAEEADRLRARHAAKIATRYGKSSVLHCWILANEPTLRLPLNPSTVAAFHRYLAKKHPDPAAFTRLYGLPLIENVAQARAGLGGRWEFAGKVDWAGFEEETLIHRLSLVGNAVKAEDSAHPTTVNPDAIAIASPYSGGRNLWRFGKCVDFLGLSCHVSWHSTRFADDRIHQSVGMFCDMTRSATAASDGAFHVTELQAGPNYFSGQRPMCPTPADIRHWLLEAAGAGATGIIYWLFNARDHGFEGLEWGLNRQDGTPSGRTRATKRVYDELAAAQALGGAKPLPPDVYLLHDVPSMVLGEIEGGVAGGGGKSDPRTPHLVADALCGAYCMLRDMGYSAGFTDGEGIAKLPADATLIVSNAYAAGLGTAQAVADFAVRGGRVIADGLFAVKDEYGDCNAAARPLLGKLFGGIVEDFGVDLGPIAMRTSCGDVTGFYLKGYFEELPGREILARWPEGEPAAVRFENNAYIGTQFFQGYFAREGKDEAARAFLAPLLPARKAPYPRNPSAQLGMRALGEFLIVWNRGDAAALDIALPAGAALSDAATGERVANPVVLAKDDIRLLAI